MDNMWKFIVVCITCVISYSTVFAKCNITLNMLGYKEASCKHQGFTLVPMDLPPDIKKLDLSYNRLTRLDSNGFLRYKYLEYLLIHNNDIRWLHTTAFSSLSLLRHLSLSRNYLNVSESYPQGVFEPLNNLSVLDISRNMKSRDYNPYKIPVSGLSNLRELSIDLVFNATFGQQFKKLKNLQVLNFDYCHVNHLYNETFSEMPVNIREFHMTTCKDFVVIEGGVLIPFPHLKVLNLTNSNIHLAQALNILHPFQNKPMDALLFRGITRPDSKHSIDQVILTPEMMKYTYTICIKALDLSANNIILVKNKSLVLFQRPECFETVIISANSFSVDSWVVDFVLLTFKMTNLKIMDFSYVPLGFKNPTFLNVITKDNVTRVEKVQGKWARQHNSMTVLIPSQIHFLRITHMMTEAPFLELKAKDSFLRHLEISYFETDFFPRINMEGFNSLDHLDLSGISSVKTIGDAKIPFLIHLKTLILRETNLINVLQTNTTILRFCPNIMNLDISNNYILKIKAYSLGQLHNLKQLNLSHNLLETIPEVVTTFLNLAELDLSYNQLSTIGKNILDWIDSQHKKHGIFKLYLNINPFICSCDATEFLRWILTTKVKLDDNGNYSCWVSLSKSSNYTKNVAEDFHHYFVDCNTTVWIKLGISLLISILSSVLCIALLFNFRWRIMFFFFRNFRKIAEKGLELQFDYDVYVSYSDDCVSFVKELQKKVENEWGFKICFEDRDFIVGEPIATERATSINRCRHIIFLVTPLIVQNEWTRFEIERAKYEKFSKNLQKIVVITRDIPLDSVPIEFATIWKDVLLIQWPVEKDAVQMAWQKLRLWFF
ncbi:toll-like receptor 4 [Mytilus galloprovincialis]|uniref:toll-like receptor 4 n=1 Tax=Mytilus galloprovincialis TaxID=29158 RepID=UPI003F7C08DA